MKFTPEEDRLSEQEVARMGRRGWTAIAAKVPNRTARQVRERWKNYLCPNVNNGPWTVEEDQLLVRWTSEIGPKWSQIATHFTNRTDVNLKNRFILLNRRERRLLKTVAKSLPLNRLQQVTDTVSKEATILYLKGLLKRLRESQTKEHSDTPAEEQGEPLILPCETDFDGDHLGSCGNNYEFDFDSTWI
jgi:hypothetical protein